MNNLSIRRNTVSGTIPIDSIDKDDTFLSFSEWHNGEGFDLEFYDNRSKLNKSISLSNDEIQAISELGVMFHVTYEVPERAYEYIEAEKLRQKEIEKFIEEL